MTEANTVFDKGADASSTEETVELEARDLVKHYNARTVVNGVSLRAACGEIVGLLGPNGAGKTTTDRKSVV